MNSERKMSLPNSTPKSIPHSTIRNRKVRRPGLRGVVLEADGETHRRDCECARCEAGFGPSERERTLAERRNLVRRGRSAALRARARRIERERLRHVALQAFFEQTNQTADVEIARLRALRERVLADRRLAELLRLRNAGMGMAQALAEVDRTMPSDDALGDAENDNGRAVASRFSEPRSGPRSGLRSEARSAERSETPPVSPPAGRGPSPLKLFS